MSNCPPTYVYTKPRVTLCHSTGLWIVNSFGQRHSCEHPLQHEEAYHDWRTAFTIAHECARTRMCGPRTSRLCYAPEWPQGRNDYAWLRTRRPSLVQT